MPLAKRILKFSLGFLVTYAILIIPWPGIQEGYESFFRTGGEFLFKSFGSKGIVRMLPADDRKLDIRLFAGNREMVMADGNFAALEMSLSSRIMGYIPTILIFSLILASPIPWKRRLWALLWGLILVNVLIALKLLIQIFAIYNSSEVLSLYLFNPFWQKVLNFSFQHFISPPGPTVVLVLIIWILVSFNKNDTKIFLKGMNAAGEKKTNLL